MAMSDCIECWSTPCICGYEYKKYTREALIKCIIGILNYHKKEASSILKEVIERIEE